MRDYPEISETQLHALWQQQKISREFLQTIDGLRLEVINPGQYNREGGPDFRRATLRLGDKILQGDVELHVRAGDWNAHGHHLDPAYNEVILHLALLEKNPDQTTSSIVRENGLPVVQMLLPEKTVLSHEQPSFSLFDCPLSKTSPEKILATVRQAGWSRLEAKASAMAEQLAHTSWDQVIYRGIAEALGYDKNQEAFRRLAELLPIELLFAELRAARGLAPEILLEALLFGAAGFLAPDQSEAESEAFVAPRRRLWENLRHTLQIRPLRPEAWLFFRLRPPNFPTRRLAALCAVILKFYRSGILEHLAGVAAAFGKAPKKLVHELLQHLICPAAGFWQWHYDLQSRPRVRRPLGDLLGRERARDIAANILLPALWLYFREAGNAVLQNQVQEAYANLPQLQTNQITRGMQKQLSAVFPLPKKIAASAHNQQGLIHLHKLFCRPLRCQECLKLSQK